MQNRWNNADAAALDGLDLLVYASRLVGADTSLVVWGRGQHLDQDGGARPPRARAACCGSRARGSDLKSIRRQDFPGVRMDDVLALLERDDMGDQEIVDYLRFALQEYGGSRPSIETLLHGFLPAQAVIHTHADAIVSLTNNDQAEPVLREVYGDIVAALHYRRPGFRISREVADLLRALRPSAE